MPFHDLVRERVLRAGGPDRHRRSCVPTSCPAGPRAATWSPAGLRTNVLHLPVRGSGDGGLYSTAADVHAFWRALFAGRIVPLPWVAEMIRPRSDVPEESRRYGLGFWLHESRDIALLTGYDAGVSFRSGHDPSTDVTWTVISNTSEGAWPVVERLEEILVG